MADIKKNITYSTILTVSGYFFPLLTFPYISRILGVSSIGIVNFIDGIINYFVLFSMLGMTNLGIRQIAACGLNKEKISKTFSSLFFINGIATLIALIALIICTFSFQKLYDNINLIIIGIIKLISNYFLIEWFYKGIEQFKFITNRSIIIKILYVIFVFIFIKDEDDYILYYALTTGMIVCNALINIIYSRKYIKLRFIWEDVKINTKPFITLGIYQILTSLYTSLNVVYLGFVGGETQVGYYSTSLKLFSLILSFFTAFTGVMIPRMSSLIETNNIVKFNQLYSKSIDVIFAFSLPLITFLEIFAEEIVYILAGNGFEGAINPMRLTLPLIIVIGIEQILVYNILIPLKKDSSIMRNAIIGAIVGLLLNIILIPNLYALGSAIVWVFSECVIATLSLITVKRNTQIILFKRKHLLYLLSYGIVAIMIFVITKIQISTFLSFCIKTFIIFIGFFICEFYINKESIIKTVLVSKLIKKR